MANNPLALLGIEAEPPQETEYDAVYAAVTATERGRWFLTEFAGRNRHADTGALAAALSRIEAVVGAGAGTNQAIATANLAAAAERIADIAFGLRERGSDPALCDALDAAVREICASSGSSGACLERAGKATLPETGEPMLTAETQPPAVDHPGSPAEEVSNSPDNDLEFELQDREKFAAAATALGASLSALDGESFEETQSALLAEQEPSTAAASSPSVGVIPAHDYTASTQPEPQPEPVVNTARWHIEAPDFVFESTARSANGHAVAPSNNSVEFPPLPPRQLLSSPQDDPAELFEPASAPAIELSSASLRVAGPAAALPGSEPASSSAQIAASAIPAASPNPVPPLRVTPRPVPINPLAALRALSEDELIALFG